MIYPDSRNAVLAPAYDIVSTLHYYARGKEELAVSLNGDRKFQYVSLDTFNPLIECLGLRQQAGREVIEEVTEAASDAWERAEVQSNFTIMQVDRLKAHLRSLNLPPR